MIQLRPDQEQILVGVAAGFRRRHRVCVVSPTGSGKTYLAAAFSDRCSKKGNVCWLIVPKPDLVEQTIATFFKLGIDCGIVCAGYPSRPHAKVQVCSIDTLRNRHHKMPPPDLLLVDECHHILAKTWSALMSAYPAAFMVGLTASPVRGDGQGLGVWFDELVLGPSVAWLMENGHLSRYRLYAPSAPDMSGVHSRAGEFVQEETEAAMKKSVIVGDIIRHHQRLAHGRKSILFAPSIKMSKEYAAAFMAAGVVAVHLDGSTSRADRMIAFRGIAAGHIDLLTNASLIGEGVDLAALAGEDVTLECLIDASPTKSLSLCLQRWGRVLRKKPEPAIILDHAGNNTRFGFPDDEREWSLDSVKKTKKKKDEEPPVTTATCGTCFYVMPLRVTVCPGCGTERVTKGRKVEMVDGELEELDVARLRDEKKRRQGEELKAARTLDQLIDLMQRWGRKDPAAHAARIMAEREVYRRERENQRRAG